MALVIIMSRVSLFFVPLNAYIYVCIHTHTHIYKEYTHLLISWNNSLFIRPVQVCTRTRTAINGDS